MIVEVPYATECPNCRASLTGVLSLTVTNYQPSGPLDTPRATMVSYRPDGDRSRVIQHHECPRELAR